MTKAERIVDQLGRIGLAIYKTELAHAYPLSTKGAIAEVENALMVAEAEEIIAQHDLKPENVPVGGGPVDAFAAKLTAELNRRVRLLEHEDEMSQTIAQVLREIVESIAVAVNP
jgi:hypothetical protein